MISGTHSIRAWLALALLTASLSACRAVPSGSTPEASEPRLPTQTPTEAGRVAPSPSPGPTVARPATAEPTVEEDGDEQSPSHCGTRDDDLFRAGLIASAQDVLEAMPGATTYEIDLHIADDLLSLEGHQHVCYTNHEETSLNEVVFRLFPNLLGGSLTVSRVSLGGRDASPRLGLADSALWLDLEDPLRPGESVPIDMDFHVEVPAQMSGNYGLFGLHDDILSLHEAYPVIPVCDDEGWNVEVPPAQADVAYYDAAFYTVHVTAPSDLVIVASGVQVQHDQTGPSQSLTIATGPARGFQLTASPHYEALSTRFGDTTVNSYATPQLAAGAALALQVTARALESYGARFGPYPYTEFDVACTRLQALGMEYPGMTVVTDQIYDPHGVFLGTPNEVMMESTVAHEVAHQWFYNVVGSDQVDEPWVDEAVVQYVTGLYYRDTYGEAGYEGLRQSWYGRWDRVDGVEIPIGLPVRDYEGAEYGAIVYGRGPLFIEALAEEMGTQVFDGFLRDYYQSNLWGIGTGIGFRELAENHCQCDLGPLFEQWVYP